MTEAIHAPSQRRLYTFREIAAMRQRIYALVVRRTGGAMPEAEKQDLVQEVALGLLRRGRNQPDKRVACWTAIHYAIKDAMRTLFDQVMANASSEGFADGTTRDYAVPHNMILEEQLGERLFEEMNEDAAAEWRAIGAGERGRRINLAALGTGTSITSDCVVRGTAKRRIRVDPL